MQNKEDNYISTTTVLFVIILALFAIACFWNGFIKTALFLMFGIPCIFLLISSSINSRNKLISDMTARLDSVPLFTATQHIFSTDYKTGLAIDEKKKKICLLEHDGEKSLTHVFLYEDLLTSEIHEDGNTITQSVRMSQAGSALVGGLLFGGVGAVVGGLSGKTQTSSKIKSIDLRITVADTKKPIYDINILNTEVSKEDIAYKSAMKNARHWHGLIAVLIKQADAEDTPATSEPIATARQERECPRCAELILVKAKVCKHCGGAVQ